MRSHDPSAAYPQRLWPDEPWLERKLVALIGRGVESLRLRVVRAEPDVSDVLALRDQFSVLVDPALRAQVAETSRRLRREGLTRELVSRAFALVREAARRELGKEHYPVQIRAGLAMLGRVIAEMNTGEGKTLTATLTAATAALAGRRVHVVTANDYLAKRDAETLAPLYQRLGLACGYIDHEMSPDQRRATYAGPVTYCSNKELAFDYLRDRVALGPAASWAKLQTRRLQDPRGSDRLLILPGLEFAIVDEADSVLIDEARTPLILSREEPLDRSLGAWQEALAMARQLVAGSDFRVNERDRCVDMTGRGEQRIQELALAARHLQGPNLARETVRKALAALYCFARGAHYIVEDGKVQIVDEYTGRLMADRSWEGGLHQLIELKEECDVTPGKTTMGRMSYQRLFRRYLHLSGMTGTAREVRGELWSTYRLRVVRIPTRLPIQRTLRPPRIYATAAEKWQAVVADVRQCCSRGQPVLVGTKTVADSQRISAILSSQGVHHDVLNAAQDRAEADVIARAGEAGVVTVATNMAGRGTDIHLGTGVAGSGGLHVVCTQPHDSRRIDRQLFGRSGRQGDPGSVQVLWSLEDDLVVQEVSQPFRRLLAALLQRQGAPASRLVALYVGYLQSRVQRRYSRGREALLQADEQGERSLAFAGRSE